MRLTLTLAMRRLRRARRQALLGSAVMGLSTAPFILVLMCVQDAFLRAPPYQRPRQLIEITATLRGCEECVRPLSRDQVAVLHSDLRAIADVQSHRAFTALLSGNGTTRQVRGVAVTPGELHVLGVHPTRGRLPLSEDVLAFGIPPLLLSYRAWRSQFAGDRAILGTVVELDGLDFSVIGVMPEGFGFPGLADCWVLDSQAPVHALRSGVGYSVVARMESGSSRQRLNSRLLAVEFEDGETGQALTLRARPLKSTDADESSVWLLAAVALLILSLGLVNGHLLQTVRALRLRRELAVAEAIGASRWDVVLQAAVEGALVGVLGAVAGFCMAALSSHYASFYFTQQVQRLVVLRPNFAVFAGVVTGAAIVGGLSAGRSALVVTRTAAGDRLREAAGGDVRASRWLRDALVVTQVALTLVVLSAAGVLAKSYWYLNHIDLGYDPDRLVVAEVRLGTGAYGNPRQLAAAIPTIRERLAALPDVLGTAMWQVQMPFAMVPMGEDVIQLAGSSRHLSQDCGRPERCEVPIWEFDVSAGFVKSVGLRILSGRDFGPSNGPGAEPVALISATAARKWWPNESSLGRLFRVGDGPWLTVIGVAADMQPITAAGMIAGRHGSIYPIIFRPLAQVLVAQASPCTGAACTTTTLAVRTRTARTTQTVNALRASVLRLAPDAVIEELGSLRGLQLRNPAVARLRLRGLLLVAISIFGGVVSIAGVYVVVARSQRARAREYSIRLALGATPSKLVTLAAGRGLALASAGLSVGLGAVYGLSSLWYKILYGPPASRSSLGSLFGTSATDVQVLTGTTLLLSLLTVLACYLPARDVTRTDPVAALKTE